MTARPEFPIHTKLNEVIVTGRRKLFPHFKTDEKRLAAYQQKFDALVTSFQSSSGTK